MHLNLLLLYLGFCQSAILPSTDLQIKIGSELLTPADLLKAKLVDKNWIGVERIFKKIAAFPGFELFLNKETNDYLISRGGLYREGPLDYCEITLINFLVECKNLNCLFLKLLSKDMLLLFESEPHIIEGLAKIVDMKVVNLLPHKLAPILIQQFPEAVLIFIQRGWNVNLKTKIFWEMTALHYAIRHANVNLTEALLDHGANVNALDHRGQTPLMLAAGDGNSASANVLLNHGADPSLVDFYGRTALDNAFVIGGNSYLCALLKAAQLKKLIAKMFSEAHGFGKIPSILMSLTLDFLEVFLIVFIYFCYEAFE